MLRWIIRIALIALALSALVFAGLFLFAQIRDWQFERALADAEAWNQTEWETGDAVEVVLELTYRMNGDVKANTQTYTCFQKKVVEWGRWRNSTRLIFQVDLFPKGFSVFHGQRRYAVRPGGGFCRDAIKDGSALRPLSDIAILDLSRVDEAQETLEDQTLLAPLGNRECRVLWDGERPVRMTRDLELLGLRVLAVERVPMNTRFETPESLGSAQAIVDRFLRRATDRRSPFNVQWSFEGQCWTTDGKGPCITEADNACGFPRMQPG